LQHMIYVILSILNLECKIKKIKIFDLINFVSFLSKKKIIIIIKNKNKLINLSFLYQKPPIINFQLKKTT
jgi:hypothetical protein